MFGHQGFAGEGLVAHIPLTTNGGHFIDTPNTKSHVTWNGTGLVDAYGNAWTMNGTVPQVSSGPLLYDGVHSRAGAGPFGLGQYYSIPTAGLFDTTGDFTAGFISWFPNAVQASYFGIVSTDATRSDGWYVEMAGGSILYTALPTNIGGGAYQEIPPQAPGLVCAMFGRTGSTGVITANGGYSGTFAWGTVSSGTTTTLGAAGDNCPGILYEFFYSTDTPVLATMQAQIARILGAVSAENEILTVTN